MCALPLPSWVTLGWLPDPVSVSAPPLRIGSITELLQGLLPALSPAVQVLTFMYKIESITQQGLNAGVLGKLDSSTGQCVHCGLRAVRSSVPQVPTAIWMNGRELALEHTLRSTLNPHKGFLWE